MTFKTSSLAARETGARPTARDVAALAGVSVGTVSRVVNGAVSVNAQVRDRVTSAIATLGWRPSIVAQNMRGRATRMIGFIFPDLDNPLFSSMIKGAEDVLTRAGYMLIVGSSNGQSEREMALIDLFGQRQADGLIFTIEQESHPAVQKCMAQARFPIVMLERDGTPAATVSAGADHFQGTLQATRHLIELGHRRIALVSGGRDNRVGRARLAGFRQAHEQAGIAVDDTLVQIDSGTAGNDWGLRKTQWLLAQADAPTAVMALGRHLLKGVLVACKRQNIRIPQDLSVVTSNDSDLAELAEPAISVIRYSTYDLGRAAAELLLDQLAAADPASAPSRTEIPTEFVLRASSAAPPVHARAGAPDRLTTNTSPR